jgi:putative endonuclease
MFVYIMTNNGNQVLYTGVTNNIVRRVIEHKTKCNSGFTCRYNVNKLVYFEVIADSKSAIKREKQIKAGSRRNKITLIEGLNPEWNDLYTEIKGKYI